MATPEEEESNEAKSYIEALRCHRDPPHPTSGLTFDEDELVCKWNLKLCLIGFSPPSVFSDLCAQADIDPSTGYLWKNLRWTRPYWCWLSKDGKLLLRTRDDPRNRNNQERSGDMVFSYSGDLLVIGLRSRVKRLEEWFERNDGCQKTEWGKQYVGDIEDLLKNALSDATSEHIAS